MKVFPEVIVIGSGVGGAMTARRLAENGVNVLMLERGDWVPKEPDNWRVASVFFDKKYTAHDTWLDARGEAFRPSIYYNVGGCTKFYGGSMIRYRERDFEELVHEEGISPAWPVSYSRSQLFSRDRQRRLGWLGIGFYAHQQWAEDGDQAHEHQRHVEQRANPISAHQVGIDRRAAEHAAKADTVDDADVATRVGRVLAPCSRQHQWRDARQAQAEQGKTGHAQHR
ncbi:MAG TPA: GMC family oxidoreductase [Gammaproteobacteria bacterium]|nr:GMC family oxidoreductase [Gammaproteobacteria bacterium]